MDPIVSTYVSSLMQYGGKGPPPSAHWKCPLCTLASLQRAEESFLRHTEQLHAEEFEEKRSQLGSDFERWRKDLIAKAFSIRPQRGHDSTPRLLDNTMRASLGSNIGELGIGQLDIGELSLQPQGGLQAANTISPPASFRKRQLEDDPTHSQPQGHGQTPTKRRSPERIVGPMPLVTGNTTAQKHPPTEPKRRSSKRTSQKHLPPGIEMATVGHVTRVPKPAPDGAITMVIDVRYPNMITQPDSRIVTLEQLAAEVKSIYSGLTMIESKCIHVDKVRTAAANDPNSPINEVPGDHWQALISLHRTLLHEHYDFFLASHHPSASLALRKLAAKYSMPGRMWKHGIQNFLELLRLYLPASREYMISFIYVAYHIMSLLYETVPSFETTWIECLGDLARYRLAVEEDVRDRETWAGVAKYWYSKAANQIPDIGRLQHHLAILARSCILERLYLYSRSLISLQAFLSARESIKTVLDQILKEEPSHEFPFDHRVVKIHALFFYHRTDGVSTAMKDFQDNLNDQISRLTSQWRALGVYIFFSHISLMFDCGRQDSELRRLFDLGNLNLFGKDLPHLRDQKQKIHDLPPSNQADQELFNQICNFTFTSAALILKRSSDKNVYPYVNVLLCFLLRLTQFEHMKLPSELRITYQRILSSVPWHDLAHWLNELASPQHQAKEKKRPSEPSPAHLPQASVAHSQPPQVDNNNRRFESEQFLRPESGEIIILPEDRCIRGAVFAHSYFPDDWFKGCGSEDAQFEPQFEPQYEPQFESSSIERYREERILWLAYNLALPNKWIRYEAKKWSVSKRGKLLGFPPSGGKLQTNDVLGLPPTKKLRV